MKKIPRNSAVIGIVLMSLSFLGFSLIDAVFKLVIPLTVVSVAVWFRFLSQGVLTLIASRWIGREYWRSRALNLQILRGFFLMTTTIFNFIALQYLPLSTTAAIFFCSPILSCCLAPLLLKERVGIHRWTAVFIGFIGALIIIRPTGDSFHWATLFSVLAALSFSMLTILTRKISFLDHQWTTFLYMPWFGIVAFLPLAISQWHFPSETWAIIGLFSLGLLGGCAHIIFIIALKHAETSLLAPFQYQQILYMTALGWFLFHDWPDTWVIVGASLVILSGFIIWYREKIKKRQQGTKE